MRIISIEFIFSFYVTNCHQLFMVCFCFGPRGNFCTRGRGDWRGVPRSFDPLRGFECVLTPPLPWCLISEIQPDDLDSSFVTNVVVEQLSVIQSPTCPLSSSRSLTVPWVLPQGFVLNSFETMSLIRFPAIPVSASTVITVSVGDKVIPVLKKTNEERC